MPSSAVMNLLRSTSAALAARGDTSPSTSPEDFCSPECREYFDCSVFYVVLIHPSIYPSLKFSPSINHKLIGAFQRPARHRSSSSTM